MDEHEKFVDEIIALAKKAKTSPDPNIKMTGGILFILASCVVTGTVSTLGEWMVPFAEKHKEKLREAKNKFN